MSTSADSRVRRARRGLGVPAVMTILLLVGVSADSATAGRDGRVRPPLAVHVTAQGCSAITTHGSGVTLGGTRVATVAHLVAGATAVAVITPDGRTHEAHLAAIDTDRDVAVLAVDDLSEPPTRLAELAAGERGTYAGFGSGQMAEAGFTVSQAASIVSEDIYVKGRHPRAGYVLAAPVRHGDSGAGLVRNDGTLGGLVWAASRNDDTQGWGVGVDELLALTTAARSGVAPQKVPCGPL